MHKKNRTRLHQPFKRSMSKAIRTCVGTRAPARMARRQEGKEARRQEGKKARRQGSSGTGRRAARTDCPCDKTMQLRFLSTSTRAYEKAQYGLVDGNRHFGSRRGTGTGRGGRACGKQHQSDLATFNRRQPTGAEVHLLVKVR